MTRELTIEEKLDWLRETVQHLATLPSLSDDDFTYIVFETLDADVTTCLHEDSLGTLVQAGHLSDSTKDELFGIRASFMALVESAHTSHPVSLPELRRDERWLAISRSCSRILADL